MFSGHTVHQELLQNVEGQTEGFDVSDNISCSSHQSSNNGFLKECSPYEEMEQPDTWDCDHEVDQSDAEIEESIIKSNNSISSCQLLDEGKQNSMILTGNNLETNTNLESVKNEKTVLKDIIKYDVIYPEEHQSIICRTFGY